MEKVKAISVHRVFSNPDVKPFDQIEWENRTAEITDDSGNVIFKQADVQVPLSWSPLATKVVVSKYFYGEQNTPERETSVRQLIHRVAKTISDWGYKDGYFGLDDADTFYDELCWLCLNQYGVFNSPVWFNVGLHHQYGVGTKSSTGNWHYDKKEGKGVQAQNQYEYPQGSACFILAVEDNMESIMNLAYSEAMLFKFGSGTGTDLSTLRSKREKLSGGGRPSGPMSFLKVYDQVANVVKSGGKCRRAAKMNTLRDWHGDIEEFIDAKQIEEKKAWALIEQGYSGSYNGDAYGSVMYQNENLSVRVSDEFMKKATSRNDNTWYTKAVTDGRNLEMQDAKALLRKIAEGTWTCGDPGLQYDGAIQKWHTCKSTEPIHSTNPCSEYVFLNNTACNLASLNLMKFKQADSKFDIDRFKAAVRIFITAQEILVDNASYPTKEIAENSHIFRTLGLGFANLGSLIMSYGLAYDSDDGRELAGAITALMTGEAYLHSACIAKGMGAFKGYNDARCSGVPVPLQPSNRGPMLDVVAAHYNEAVQLVAPARFEPIRDAAIESWEEALNEGKKYGFRNAQLTVLAPTGTIAFMMDCDTTGVEPDIALVKYKLLAGGGNLKIVNRTVTEALKTLGYGDDETATLLKHIQDYDTIEDVGEENTASYVRSIINSSDLPVFDCAFKATNGKRSISYTGHLKMMAACQPFISGAISKTVNLPNSATVEDIEKAYIMAWSLGLKCVAVYRDGSKRSQPLNTSKSKGDSAVENEEVKVLREKLRITTEEVDTLCHKLKGMSDNPIAVRNRLPDTREARTHKFNVGGHEGYITVGMFEDGSPGELFIQMAKEGSTIGGLMDTIGTLTSLALQYGVSIETLARKFSHQRFEPSGFTKNPEIKNASSIIDYVFRWLELQFVEKEPETITGTETPSTLQVKWDGGALVDEKVTIVKSPNNLSSFTSHFQLDAPTCPGCGHVAVRNGSCYKCLNCGESLGCS